MVERVFDFSNRLLSMQRKFAAEHGLGLSPPPVLSLRRQRDEVEGLRRRAAREALSQ